MKLVVALALCLLSACAAAVLHPEQPAQTPYVLGAGDNIKVTIFGEDKLSGEHKVDGRELIQFPLVGEVSVKGKTIPQFQADLAGRLSQGYLKSPKITVDLVTTKPIYILGEVERPGEFPFADSMTIFQAVAKAGGFTYRANRSRVFVLHYGEKTETKYVLTPSTPLAPGDTIRIGERYF